MFKLNITRKKVDFIYNCEMTNYFTCGEENEDENFKHTVL